MYLPELCSMCSGYIHHLSTYKLILGLTNRLAYAGALGFPQCTFQCLYSLQC